MICSNVRTINLSSARVVKQSDSIGNAEGRSSGTRSDMRFSEKLSARLRQVGISRQAYPVWVSLLWRGVLLGTALFLSLSDDRYQNLRHNLIAYLVALVWSYYDGAITHRRWSLAWFEGLLLYLVAVAIANLLSLTIAHPIVAA